MVGVHRRGGSKVPHLRVHMHATKDDGTGRGTDDSEQLGKFALAGLELEPAVCHTVSLSLLKAQALQDEKGEHHILVIVVPVPIDVPHIRVTMHA